jgi:hypothetical protein
MLFRLEKILKVEQQQATGKALNEEQQVRSSLRARVRSRVGAIVRSMIRARVRVRERVSDDRDKKNKQRLKS